MRRPAFTLIEVMLAIALIGVALTLLFTGADSLLSGGRKDSPYETLRKAVDAAWYGAAIGHEQYVLEYDADAKAILVRPLAANRATDSAADTETDARDPRRDRAVADPDSRANSAAAGDPAAGAAPSSRVQLFPFESDRVDSLVFTSPPDDGDGSLRYTRTQSLPRIYFSPWGGSTPARIGLTAQGRLFTYRLDPFGGALIEETSL